MYADYIKSQLFSVSLGKLSSYRRTKNDSHTWFKPQLSRQRHTLACHEYCTPVHIIMTNTPLHLYNTHSTSVNIES